MKSPELERFLSSLLLIFVLQLAGAAQTPAVAEYQKLFEYDSAEALDVKEVGVQKKQSASVYDISYVSPKGGRVTAFLVAPTEKGKYGGAIFLHGRGANRSQFLPEALRLAQSGIVSLLIDAPASRPEPWNRSPYKYLEADRDIRIQTVIDVRRGVDLLLARKDIDAKRLAFIGYSAGGTMGSVLAGVEKRIKAYVLMTATDSEVEFWREPNNPAAEELKKRLTPEKFELYVKSLEAVEPVLYIGKAAPAALLFQFAKDDEIVPAKSAQKLYEAASKPKTVRWYKTTHSLNVQATNDRIEWVIEKIGTRLLEIPQNQSAGQSNF